MKITHTALLFLCFNSIKAQSDSSRLLKTDSAVYFSPEIQAEYPGGLKGWYQYLVKNMKYPENAQANEIQGQVITQFIIDSAGYAHDVTVISGPKELRSECVRLIKKVAVWTPAIMNGKKVNSWKTQPFIFKLETQ